MSFDFRTELGNKEFEANNRNGFLKPERRSDMLIAKKNAGKSEKQVPKTKGTLKTGNTHLAGRPSSRNLQILLFHDSISIAQHKSIKSIGN